MTHKKIEQYRKKLIEIISREKQSDGSLARGTKEDLQKLAKIVGASTRAIYPDSAGMPRGYDADISDLIDNIHTSLQTASMIETCRIATRSWIVAAIALIISTIGTLTASAMALIAAFNR